MRNVISPRSSLPAILSRHSCRPHFFSSGTTGELTKAEALATAGVSPISLTFRDLCLITIRV